MSHLMTEEARNYTCNDYTRDLAQMTPKQREELITLIRAARESSGQADPQIAMSAVYFLVQRAKRAV